MRSFFKKNDATKDQSTADSTGEKGTVLIVDDSPTEIHILRGVLEKAGYSVLTAEDGETGIQTAVENIPDLILMDVVMPGLNGFQATRQLSKKSETSHIPIIMVTTKDQETDRAWGLRQGAKEYVVKPVKPAELLEKVNSVLQA
ncbi:MAG: response regulator [Chromatiales bacterium]|nr:response regulator [Chromatiales bacterium]